MKPSILSQSDLDDVARDMADEDRRQRTITWRWIAIIVALEIAAIMWVAL